MSKKEKIEHFDPSGVALKNNNFIGLPFTEEEADIVLFPVPWDVTVSYADGTHNGPTNILEASYQLDLYDSDVPEGWKQGYYFAPIDEEILSLNHKMRAIAKPYIEKLEDVDYDNEAEDMVIARTVINQASEHLNNFVYQQTSKYLNQDKIVGLIGGDHSTPLGMYKALGERYREFGIICIDAHLDLRKSYEGFTYSHASVFYNALSIPTLSKLVQVGIRDCAHSEVKFAENRGDRVEPFFDAQIKKELYRGEIWDNICKNIVDRMPEHVVVSIDIDGLNPTYCPNTGTPVPGGLEYQELIHLLRCIPERNRKIIGFDVVEVGGTGEWDGNVGARLIYKLGNLAGKSMGKIQ